MNIENICLSQRRKQLLLALLTFVSAVFVFSGCSVNTLSSEACEEKITFCVLGDPQALDDGVRVLVEKIAEENPDFVLIPGDCIMANGADPQPWDRFFEIFAPLYTQPNTTLYAVAGNHDTDGGFDPPLREAEGAQGADLAAALEDVRTEPRGHTQKGDENSDGL